MIQTIDISKWDIVEERKNIAGFVKQALCTQGVFYATGHKISPELVSSLFTKSKEFFSLEIEYKSTIDVKLSGPAIRGYFCADNREGLCFGSEDGASHALVVSGSILHGQNSFPQRPASIGPVVLAWQQAAKELGQTLLEIFSVALGQEPTFLHNRFAQDPLILTRIFNYFVRDENIAMDKHTDFSFFTLLQQDDVGGLQILDHKQDLWLDATGQKGAVVVFPGDILARISVGLFRAPPHRVLQPAQNRVSCTLLFGTDWSAQLTDLASDIGDIDLEDVDVGAHWPHICHLRSENQSILEVEGTFENFITKKLLGYYSVKHQSAPRVDLATTSTSSVDA